MMFLIIEIEKKKTPLYSPRTQQNWKPALAGCNCQRSETPLSGLISQVKANENYFRILPVLLILLSKAQHIRFRLDPAGHRWLLQHRQRGVWSNACGGEAVATETTLLHQCRSQRAAPLTDAVRKKIKAERRQEQQDKNWTPEKHESRCHETLTSFWKQMSALPAV